MFAVVTFTNTSQKMATFRVNIQPHHLKADGTYNIKIRVLHGNKVRYIATQYFEPKTEFNKRLEFRNGELRAKYANIEQQYRDSFDKIACRAQDMTVDEVVDFVKRDIATEGVFSLDVIEYGKKVAERKGAGSCVNYIAALNSLLRFNEDRSLDISAITTRFLESWANWLQTDNGGKPVQGRGVSLYLGCLRAIHNEAKREYNDEDLGVINIKSSPFSRFKMPAMPVTRKRALSVEQIRSIAKLEDHISYHAGTDLFTLSRDVFMLSFYLVGMNSVDLYGCKDFGGERITYCRAKTAGRRADHAEISIKLESKASVLFEKYRDPDGLRVFRFYKMYKNADIFNASLNRGLKRIGAALNIEDLEFYAARHSWATIARNDCKIDKYTVHTALNHVDEAMRVTDIYIKRDWTEIDEANRKVLSYVFDAE